MITQIRYYNFKSLKDVICDLSRLTVIVGPNASGKSSMLQGLDLLSRLSERFRPEDIVQIFSGSQDLDLLHSGDANAPVGLDCYNGHFCFSFSAKKQSVNPNSRHFRGHRGVAMFISIRATRRVNLARS